MELAVDMVLGIGMVVVAAVFVVVVEVFVVGKVLDTLAGKMAGMMEDTS